MKVNFDVNGTVAKLSVYSMMLIPIMTLILIVKTMLFGIKVKIKENKPKEQK